MAGTKIAIKRPVSPQSVGGCGLGHHLQLRDELTKTVASIVALYLVRPIRDAFLTIARRHPVRVFTFHRVSDRYTDPLTISRARFSEFLEFVRRSHDVVSLEEAIKLVMSGARLRRPAAAITFDDGYYNNFSEAFPSLMKYGFSATIFLAAGLIENGEVRKNIKSWHPETFLNWSEVCEMQKAGIDFQSHGLYHKAFDVLSTEELEEELVVSKELIEKKIDGNVTLIAYPFGRYSDKVKLATKRAKYKGACGGLPPADESANAFSDFYEIGRTEILGTDSVKKFKFKVRTGVTPAIFFRRKLGSFKRKVILSHQTAI